MVLPLTRLSPGQKGVIVWIANDDEMSKRLSDLGFSSGEEIECILAKPRNGMRAYLIQHAMIALRFYTAREIFVRI